MVVRKGTAARCARGVPLKGKGFLLALAVAMAAVAPARADGVQDLERCRQAYEADAPDVAKGLCSRALKDESLPPATRAVGHLLRAWSTRGYLAALPDFEAAVRLAPDFSIAHRELGVAYYRLNRHDDALRALTAATKLEPRDTSSWYWRARVLVLLGRTTEALRDAERVVQLSPKWSEGWFLKGELQANLGRLDLAFDDLGRSLKLQPTHAYALARRSLLLAEVGDSKAAWTDADAAVRHSPQDASLLLDRGRIALLQGKDAAAIADMTDALSRLEDRRLKLYGALWMMIAVLRSGTELHHQPNVRAFIDDGNKTEWPAPLAWVYLAALSKAKADWKETVGDPAKYLGPAQQAATEPNQSRTEDRKCESDFFLGMYHVLTGEAVRGEDLLRQAASRRVNSWSYIGAKAELARLGQRQAGGKVR